MHLIDGDICDIYSNPTKTGKKYFVTFVENFSKYCYLNLLHYKDKFKIYKNKVENFYYIKIKCLKSDKKANTNFLNFVNLLALCMKLALHICYNKMAELKGKIGY